MINVEAKDIPPSKSLYNRALILKSFSPSLNIFSESEFEAEDVLFLKKALDDLALSQTEFYCGSGAAPLRFLALRLSRCEGSFKIKGTERLFSRPQEDLLSALKSLGCQEVKLEKDSLSFSSTGKWPEKIDLNLNITSQVLSGILLAAWDLETSCELHFDSENATSWTYAQMTLVNLQQAGWQGELSQEGSKRKVILPQKQKIVLDDFVVEPDMSCVAALAFLGAAVDGIRFWSLPLGSLQGDSLVFEVLQKMGHRVLRSPTDFPQGYENIRIEKSKSVQGIEIDLKATPDLFPVLAAYSVSAKSPSKFKSLGNLNHKESRRLDRMRELLTSVGARCEVFGNDFSLYPIEKFREQEVFFDSDEDHRLVMAAEILNALGAKIKIKNPEVVNKSFPNFWEIVKYV